MVVVDAQLDKTASGVAAGVCNPLVLKRFTKGWMADTTWPLALKFYSGLQDKLGAKFFRTVQIARVFSSVGEQNDWMARCKEEGFEQYLSNEIVDDEIVGVNQPLGHGVVKSAGHLIIPGLIANLGALLSKEGRLVEGSIANEELEFTPGKVRWKDIEANKIIFCDGISSMQSPWFDKLPFAPTKGEVIKVKIDGPEIKHMIHSSVFLLPLGDGTYLCGSTFNRDDIDWKPSEKGREELLKKLSGFISGPFEVVDHKAGIRPTTRDRRPFVGFHPETPQIGILNGLGSRGGILAPWLAQMFAESIVDGTPLNSEVDIIKYF